MIGRIWFPTLLVLSVLFVLIDGTPKLPFRGMLFPLLIGGLIIVLSMVEIIRGITGKAKDEEEGVRKLKELRFHLPSLLLVLAIAPMIWIFGFVLAVSLHAFLFLKYNGEKWRLSAAVAVSLAIIFYFGLQMGMRIPFNDGLLFEYLKG
jgi:hypothetical protein